jgi:hypothetical protein
MSDDASDSMDRKDFKAEVAPSGSTKEEDVQTHRLSAHPPFIINGTLREYQIVTAPIRLTSCCWAETDIVIVRPV